MQASLIREVIRYLTDHDIVTHYHGLFCNKHSLFLKATFKTGYNVINEKNLHLSAQIDPCIFLFFAQGLDFLLTNKKN